MKPKCLLEFPILLLLVLSKDEECIVWVGEKGTYWNHLCLVFDQLVVLQLLSFEMNFHLHLTQDEFEQLRFPKN